MVTVYISNYVFHIADVRWTFVCRMWEVPLGSTPAEIRERSRSWQREASNCDASPTWSLGPLKSFSENGPAEFSKLGCSGQVFIFCIFFHWILPALKDWHWARRISIDEMNPERAESWRLSVTALLTAGAAFIHWRGSQWHITMSMTFIKEKLSELDGPAFDIVFKKSDNTVGAS